MFCYYINDFPLKYMENLYHPLAYADDKIVSVRVADKKQASLFDVDILPIYSHCGDNTLSRYSFPMSSST